MTAVLRIARPTDDIQALLGFYRDSLGLQELFRFEDHDGFDGIMLGHPRAPWHLEFTRRRGASGGPGADTGRSAGVLPARHSGMDKDREPHGRGRL